MMNPQNLRQATCGYHQYQPVASVEFNDATQPRRKLCGAKARRTIGILQIICGVIEIPVGIAVIRVVLYYHYNRKYYFGWEIWNGLFAILTGCLGFYSLRKKWMVILYMITSIIAAVLCVGCLTYAVVGALDSSHGYDREANMTMYIFLCITFFTQMVISIVGASFTCGALCPDSNQPQQIVYYTAQLLPLQYVPPPQYSEVAFQDGPTSRTTTLIDKDDNM